MKRKIIIKKKMNFKSKKRKERKKKLFLKKMNDNLRLIIPLITIK